MYPLHLSRPACKYLFQMPFLDGPGMIRAIRRIDPSVKVIAMSGLMNPEHTPELEALNISAFLAKPFTAEELLTKLAAALHPYPPS